MNSPDWGIRSQVLEPILSTVTPLVQAGEPGTHRPLTHTRS